MSYEMNAEGNNGVTQMTTIDNLGITGPGDSTVILLVRGDVPYPYPNPYIDVAGIQASGNNSAPGVVGYNFGGEVSLGVGVAGISQVVGVELGGVPTRAFPSIDPLTTLTAGVYGFCEGGPGVLGQGSDALNTVYGDPPVAAGMGVVGQGGKSTPATTLTADGLPPVTNPALPAGAGVVGLGENASMPDPEVINGVGIVGVGSPQGPGVMGVAAQVPAIVGGGPWAGWFDGQVSINGSLGVGGPLTVVGTFAVFGVKAVAIPFPDQSHRLLYCMESPECWFEDFGEAKLVRGKARVKLPRDFATVIKTNSYHVFLTPSGNSKGLYVSKRDGQGFVVEEQGQGKSNLTFSYRIVGKRKDVKAERFAKVSVPTFRKPPKLASPPTEQHREQKEKATKNARSTSRGGSSRARLKKR